MESAETAVLVPPKDGGGFAVAIAQGIEPRLGCTLESES